MLRLAFAREGKWCGAFAMKLLESMKFQEKYIFRLMFVFKLIFVVVACTGPKQNTPVHPTSKTTPQEMKDPEPIICFPPVNPSTEQVEHADEIEGIYINKKFGYLHVDPKHSAEDLIKTAKQLIIEFEKEEDRALGQVKILNLSMLVADLEGTSPSTPDLKNLKVFDRGDYLKDLNQLANQMAKMTGEGMFGNTCFHMVPNNSGADTLLGWNRAKFNQCFAKEVDMHSLINKVSRQVAFDSVKERITRSLEEFQTQVLQSFIKKYGTGSYYLKGAPQGLFQVHQRLSHSENQSRIPEWVEFQGNTWKGVFGMKSVYSDDYQDDTDYLMAADQILDEMIMAIAGMSFGE